MTKAIFALIGVVLAMLCISSLAQEDMASYWTNKGNESLETLLRSVQIRLKHGTEKLASWLNSTGMKRQS